MNTSLGGKVATLIPTVWGDLTPEIKLARIQDLMQSPIVTEASLAGVGFTSSTLRTAPDGAQIELSTTLQRNDYLSMSIEYDGDLRQGYSSHSGQIKAKWDF